MNLKRIVSKLALLGLFLVSAGCGTKSMVVLVPNLDGDVGQVVVATAGGQKVLTEANHSVQARGRKAPPGEITTLSVDEVRSTFSEALAAQPLPPTKFILYFMQDSDEMTGESKAVIAQIIQAIKDRGAADIIISGHADTVGKTEYNSKLSLNRAKVVYDVLVANGAQPADIKLTAHGEDQPLIKTADNVPEPRNRRVEVGIK